MSIAWPTLTRTAPAEFSMFLQSNTMTHESPLTNGVQTLEMPGARWGCSFSLSGLDETDATILQAFLVKLRGQAGRFTLHNFARPMPRGTIAGTPLVKGGSQTGNTLVIDGVTNGTTLKIGDFFGVNGELKMVVADVTAALGEMTVTFEPPLRSPPADNAPITTTRPTATFMLTDDTVQWLTRPGLRTDIPISAVESWV